MKIFRFVLFIGLLLENGRCFAQGRDRSQDFFNQVVKAANDYANAISCRDVKVEVKDVVALVPYNGIIEDRPDAKYVALWNGDIGCGGGSGTYKTRISTVRIGAGTTFVVDPLESSPLVKFESPARWVDSIVSNTRNSLVLDGKEYGANDANCCPTVSVRFTLRVDDQGHWRLIDKKVRQ